MRLFKSRIVQPERQARCVNSVDFVEFIHPCNLALNYHLFGSCRYQALER